MSEVNIGEPLGERSTLAQQAFTRIKELILNGDLSPGESISEPAFARALGISRTSLREALFRLEAQGYAERGGSNRWRIFDISEDSARDIYQCRGVLQGLAARLATASASLEQVSALRVELDAARKADADGQIHDVIVHSTRFHELIIECAGNEKLAFLLEILRPQLLLNRRVMLVHSKHRRDILSRNEELFAAVSGRDPERAAKTAIWNAEKDLEAVLKLFREGVFK